MRWKELIQEHQVYLIRLNPDLWSEIQEGRLRSMELLRASRNARLPEFSMGDLLVLYSPQMPDEPPPALSHAIAIRQTSSSETGYGLGPLFQLVPAISKHRLIFSSDRGSLPDVFKQADERTFVVAQLTRDERDKFIESMLTAGIRLEIVKGKGGPEKMPAVETTGPVDLEL